MSLTEAMAGSMTTLGIIIASALVLLAAGSAVRWVLREKREEASSGSTRASTGTANDKVMQLRLQAAFPRQLYTIETRIKYAALKQIKALPAPSHLSDACAPFALIDRVSGAAVAVIDVGSTEAAFAGRDDLFSVLRLNGIHVLLYPATPTIARLRADLERVLSRKSAGARDSRGRSA
jgi:hypothetical protein